MITPPIAILKSVWARNSDGEWRVTDLKSLTLKPRQGCDPTYFTIDSDFELMTQSPTSMSIQQVLASVGTTELLMKRSILPVVAWRLGDALIRTIGTASVISCSGYVVTAAHVLLDPLESQYGARRQGDGLEFDEDLNLGVLVPRADVRGETFLPFEGMWIWGEWKESPLLHEPARFQLTTDVAICKIPQLSDDVAHQPLHMSLNPFTPQEAAYAIGYAEMQPIPIEHKNEVITLKIAPADLYVSIGLVGEVFPRNHTERNVPTPGPCFDFHATIPGKMSGAPVFGAAGAIIRGVVSRSFQAERHAYGAMLGPAMDLPLEQPGSSGRTLRSMMRGGNQGMARVYGHGL